MTAGPVVAALSVAVGAALTFGVPAVLHRLQEPPDPGDKEAYSALATRRFVLVCALLGAVAQLTAGLSVATVALPLWTVLSTCAVFLAAVDARTTWIPTSTTYGGWVLMLLASLLSLLLGADAGDLLRTLVGAGVAGLLYHLVWAVTRGGFGYGDVRFAPLLGAAAAAQSWTLLLWALTLGTFVGGGHGVVRLLRRQVGGFPYAPSMLIGSFAAAVALRLLPTAPTP